MSIQAFGPRGLTHNISCNQTSSAAVRVTSDQGCYTYQFVNTGGNQCWFSYGNSAALTVSIPVPGTPANGVSVLPNEIVVYNLNPNIYISCICASGQTTNIEVTPGEGM
jgi:hypothetical protein